MSTQHETIYLGGGCFWCTEAVFKMLRGVTVVEPGYAGGKTKNPNYYSVSEGNTGHAEVIRIEYNPQEIMLGDLLTVFFATHDPTTMNQQGADIGTQYRSIILYTTDAQRKETEAFIKDLNASSTFGKAIVTEIAPFEAFFPAEEYHKDYYERNKDSNPYCEVVINPKLEKVQKRFAELLKVKGKE